jgi:CPA1 family monovalent cation:H+ antiporter
MQDQLIDYIYLILIILGLVMIANKAKLAYPIILVLGGLVLSLFPGFSSVTIDPEFIFFIFLPPLLYEAAWQMSWKEFWKWRRVIMSFAFPIVILTSCVIAFVAHALIPGFTLALGFLLGGIISPPDAISATTIMRRVNVPKSMISIAEGESLLNDASSLVVFRFALAAVITGQFHFKEALFDFFLVIVMGTLIGLAVGVIFYAIHRWLPTTPSIEIVLTLLTPYCMYYFAEHFHFSGVLAVVSGGLLLSHHRNNFLSYESRIQGVNVWSNLVFVLNGLIFLLIGLQLPSIIGQLGDISFSRALAYGLIISAVLIITRLLCTLGASLFTRFMSRFITVAEAKPGWRGPFVLGWAGMRGVVSLAAALAIPLIVREGEAFPYRNLILFITFVVILVTLVFQGLTLPWLVRKLKPATLGNPIPGSKQEILIQKKIAKASIQYLDDKHGTGIKNEHLANLYSRLQLELDFFHRQAEEKTESDANMLKAYQAIYLELLDEQRKLLTRMNKVAEFDEDVIRKYMSFIDLEELSTREKLLQL